MGHLNIADYRQAAKRRLPRGIFEYVDRGTEDEIGLAGLRAAFEDIHLVPRILTDVSTRNLSCTIFGKPLSFPAIIAPTAAAGLLWHDGEAELARAAKKAGIPFCAATQSITSIEDIAARGGGADLWFQLYIWNDRELTRRLLDRVAAAGVTTIVLTADTPMSPKREYNIRNGFSIPIEPTLAGGMDVVKHPRWAWKVLGRYLRQGGMPNYANYPREFRQPVTRQIVADRVKLAETLTWNDVRSLRNYWRGKLVIKGVLHPDDARKAVELGCDGIVVSSHGGRNLDSAPPPTEILGDVTAEVGGRTTILVDSGVRRGSDIVKYIALGADAVLVGRAILYGVAVAGQAGASDCLDILREEMSKCLAFLGHSAIRNLPADVLRRRDNPGARRPEKAAAFAR